MSTTTAKSAKTPAETPKGGPPSSNLLATSVFVVMAAVIAVIILRIPALSVPWAQGYDPTGHWFISTLIAALPVVVLLGSLALGHAKAHYAALMGLATAILVAIFAFHMPARLAAFYAFRGRWATTARNPTGPSPLCRQPCTLPGITGSFAITRSSCPHPPAGRRP